MSDTNEKLIKNMISYFNETKITDQLRKDFSKIVCEDEQFQAKLNQLMDENKKPECEKLWRKILESEGDLVSNETKSKLFSCFKDVLQPVFKTENH
ncbi:hypothetical protein RUM44_007225 [Polyplax serrata]|uniref:Uncharacterized protein n=1 Tax=Polyplax serrata TaxID=468196 RepID=A0ABR1B1S0_POLSC